MPPPASTMLLSIDRGIPTLGVLRGEVRQRGGERRERAEIGRGVGLEGRQGHEEDRRGRQQGHGPGQSRQGQLPGMDHDSPPLRRCSARAFVDAQRPTRLGLSPAEKCAQATESLRSSSAEPQRVP